MIDETTAQRRVCALETAYANLLHSISHDMRAPVRHAVSYVPLIREALHADPPQRAEALDLLTSLEQSVRHMGHMLEGLQALSQVASAPLRLQAVALNTAIDAARATLATQRTLECTWSIAENLPTVWADRALLQQLLVHLLDNACKFTQNPAETVISIDAVPSLVANATCIRIGDNGVGFDKTRSSHLFGIFQRMHRAADFDGIGVGLALCQAIAKRHNAYLSVDTAPEKGCTVLMDWPVPSA